MDLFDQAEQPVTQASLWNEGKIHLGLIFAKDRHERTSDVLLTGALHFDSALQRLTARTRPAGLLSTAFRYLVHRTSQLSADAITAHFGRVAARYRALREATGLSYFDHASDFVWEPIPDRAWRAEHDDRSIVAAFRTAERSVDPGKVAGLLRQAVAEQDAIRFQSRCRVDRVDLDGAERPRVVLAQEGSVGPYDAVVNALWQDRLRVDATAGVQPERPWLHRFKLAIHMTGASDASLPSATVMLGEYGDIVDFGGGRRYLSWYPACKLGEWRDLQPADITCRIDDATRKRVLESTLSSLATITPAVASLDLSAATVKVEGGYIFAWGRTDIADPDSELHTRNDVGIRSRGRYHSIDTGKYGMAPYFAEQLADRLCGKTAKTHYLQAAQP